MPSVCQGGNELTTPRKAFVAVLLILILAFDATAALAVPSSKLAQARAVKSQIERLDAQAEIQADRYSEAASAHAKLLKEKKAAEKRLKKIESRKKVVQRHLNSRAKSMYRSGPVGFIEVLLGAETYEEFATTWDILKDLNSDDANAVAQLKVLRKEATAAKKVLSAKEKAAAGKKASMRAALRAAQAALSSRKAKLRGLEREIAALEAAERRARSRSAASYVSRPAANEHFPPPSRAPRSQVVSVARRYIGAPYRWGATGPNSFDCSGFTSFVYRQVGVYLPRVSRAQIGAGERVSRSELQPGDLVFFGSPIHHVGIYVGGGMMIHAPHTGARVRIDPLHSNYVGAARP